MAKQPVSVVEHRPWSEINDHGLMPHIAGANKQAFTELARRHMPVMLGFAKRYVNISDAEDVVQEALTRLWLKASQWQDRGLSVRSWLMRIVYNLCMDHRRAQHGNTEQLTDEFGSSLATPEGIYEQDMRQRQLAQALQNLPERQRSAIYLTLYHAMSNKEIAEVLGVSVEALESLLSRGRKGLKEIIKQQGEA